MQAELTFEEEQSFDSAISPLEEAGAYEALWDRDGMWFKELAELFARSNTKRPSSLVPEETRHYYVREILDRLQRKGGSSIGVAVHGMTDYPDRLEDAEHPVELLYYDGWWNFTETRSISIVGTRKPSEAGIRRAKKLTRALVSDEFTIVSGLARGIDTVVHETAIECGGNTIAVLGTPVTESYPKENLELQRRIAEDWLVVSQVPIIRYEKQFYKANRYFFPERNKTMSALSEATIIVEAGEGSGTLIQARAALHQGRKLFILDSCFETHEWPHKFEKLGAHRIRDYEELLPLLDESRADEV